MSRAAMKAITAEAKRRGEHRATVALREVMTTLTSGAKTNGKREALIYTVVRTCMVAMAWDDSVDKLLHNLNKIVAEHRPAIASPKPAPPPLPTNVVSLASWRAAKAVST